MPLEDVSMVGDKSVVKKTIKEGEGTDRPCEGASVTVRLEAIHDATGEVLVSELEVTFDCASGRFCSAVEETLLTMKKGGECEVRCANLAACTDEELGLKPASLDVTMFRLALLDFVKMDLHGLTEPER